MAKYLAYILVYHYFKTCIIYSVYFMFACFKSLVQKKRQDSQ